MTKLLLLGNLSVSWALFALIWVVQLVHYPTFRYIEDFPAFHQHHTTSITLIVGPLMLAEIALAGLIFLDSQWNWQWGVLFAIVIAIWGLTFFWAVPIHEKLGLQSSKALIEQLIIANWPRTVLWTIKAIWVSWLVWGERMMG
ncbi:MAG: hypothetical protein AAF828_05805 [Bacteroidota bacterium]